MNFLYFLTVMVVISSTCNCEIAKSSANANSTGYHLSVPLSTRIATILFLSATVWLVFMNDLRGWPFKFTTADSAVLSTFATLIFAILFVGFGVVVSFFTVVFFSPVSPSLRLSLLEVSTQQWEFGTLTAFGWMIVMTLCLHESVKLSVSTPLWYFFVSFAFNLPFACLIVIVVHVEIYSAFIRLGIAVTIGYVGANLISSRLGHPLWNVATVNLMFLANTKLLVTLSTALNEGKFIWPLSITLVKTLLIILTIRSVSIAYVCRWARSQHAIDAHMFIQLQVAFQLSLSCVLGYLISLVYSTFAY